MPDNSIQIRVSARDDGVRDVMRAIRDEMKRTAMEAGQPILGPAIKPRYEFDEKVVRDAMTRLLAKARSIAEREKIRLQAELIMQEARERLGTRGTPSIDARGIDVEHRRAIDQSRRDRKAQALRDERNAAPDGSLNKRAFEIAERSAIEQSRRDREAAEKWAKRHEENMSSIDRRRAQLEERSVLEQSRRDRTAAEKRAVRNAAAEGSLDRRAFDIAERSALEQSRRDREAQEKRAQRAQRATDAADEAVASKSGGRSRTRRSGRGGGDDAGTVDELRNAFGRGGQFTQIARMLQGAGPILGIGLAARELGAVSEAAVKLRDSLEDSSKNAADLTQDFAESLPILGDIAKTGHSINELFTEQDRIATNISVAAAATITSIAAQREMIDAANERHKVTLATVRQIRQEIERTHTAPTDLPRLAAKQEQETVVADADQKRDEEVKSAKDAAEKALNQVGQDKLTLRDRLKQAQAHQGDITAAQATVDYWKKQGVRTQDSDAAQKVLDKWQLAQSQTDVSQIERTRDEIIKKAEEDRRSVIAEQGKLTAAEVAKVERDIADAREKRHAEAGDAVIKSSREASRIADQSNAEEISAEQERSGKAFEAEITRSNARLVAEYLAAQHELDDQLEKIEEDRKAKAKNDPSQTKEIDAEAARQATAATAKADAQKQAAETGARIRGADARKRQDDLNADAAAQEQQGQQKITSISVAAAAARLKATGHTNEAEKLERKEALEQQLADVKANLDAQLRLHPERRASLIETARQTTEALQGKYAADEEASLAEKKRQELNAFKPGAISGETRLLTGVTGPHSPLQKATDQVAKNTETAAKIAQSIDLQISRLIAAILNQPPVPVTPGNP